MKKYLCFILFSLFTVAIFGQLPYEHRLATAIDLGTHDKPFTFTDSQYTGDFADDFQWDPDYIPTKGVKEVFYRVTLTRSLGIKFNVTRTDRFRTTIILLDATGKKVETGSNGYTVFGLLPGVHYFVVEGDATTDFSQAVPDDTISVQVDGSPRTTGEDFFYPFELGRFSTDFNITPTANNISNFKNDYRVVDDPFWANFTHDVVFHFTLDCPMRVSLSEKGFRSTAYNYYEFKLMNAAKDTICTSTTTNDNLQQYELSSGDYYIYAWGLVQRYTESAILNCGLRGTAIPPGNDFSYPVEAGRRFSDFTYTDTRNTSTYSSSRHPEKIGKEAHYRITLTQPMKIDINTCGSEVTDTYLKVFTSDRKLMFFNDDYSGAGACSNTQSACLKIASLPAGTYYIVTDAAGNGDLITTITGTVIDNPGDSPDIAIDLGTHKKGFSFSDIRDTSSKYSNHYQGKPTCDVYYRFTLEQPMDVTVDHENSFLADTSLSLLNQNGTLVKASGNSSGHASLDFKLLPAGTYYIVSEGITTNGQITTNVHLWGLYDNLKTTIGQPHIITLTPIVATGEMDALRQTELLQEIQYFNHLGLPTEKIQRGITPGRNDLITLQEYDGMDRETKQWLPTPKEDAQGAYVQPYEVRQTAQESELHGSDSHPYSLTIYDGSLLGRITEQYGTGKDWHVAKKSVCTDYLTNANDEVALGARMYHCTETALTCAGDYANGSLAGIKTTDEDGHASYEFKDKAERLVLSRRMNGTECLDTYFVYDKSGNLRFVLPPLAADALAGSNVSWNEDNVVLKKYAYVYKYDAKNRCIYKKLPGCEPVYTVYDAADRPVFTQDGLQRDKGEWMFSISDAFGRIVVNGTCKNVLNYAANPLDSTIIVKAAFGKTTNAAKGYLISGITLDTPVVWTANYYDHYDFIGQNGIPSGVVTAYETVAGYGKRYSGGCRGQQTGSLTARFSKTGVVTGYLYSVMYYDERGRMVQQKGNNELGGTGQVYTAYRFTGKPSQVKQVCTIPGKEMVTELRQHTYDHADRLLRTTYQLNNAIPVVLVDNVYDEAGRLKTERRNGNAKLKTDYVYNVRSWTKSISGPLFNQTLYYQENLEGNLSCYNGNISSMLWKAGQTGNESGYRFTYDGISRMKDAIYGETNTLSVNQNRFNEQITSYDKMGNILGLLRYGQTSAAGYGLIDNLNLAYDGNQLKKVTDNAVGSAYGNGFEFKDGATRTIEYLYDKNGNLTKDLNKNIVDIQYNCLNLPRQITFADGNRIEYEYGADGRKLRTIHVTDGTTLTTDYCGNAVYENGVLKMLLNESGYASFPDKKFHFYLKDHQGNVRVVADQDGNVEETNGYYPFGGLMANASASVQPYKYNGKELDRRNGLDWYDYGARHYDAALGRWMTVDPMSEKLYYCSPYAYCINDPVKHMDPDGQFPWVAGLIGGGIDYVSQVAMNKLQGKSWSESLTNVDKGSILTSAVTSMTGVGLANVVSKAITVSKVAQTSTKVAAAMKVGGEIVVDAAVSTASQLTENGQVKGKAVFADVVSGQAGQIVGKHIRSSYQNSAKGEILHRQADHDRRVAGAKPRDSRAKRAKQSAEKAGNYGSGIAGAASSTVSSGASEIVDYYINRDDKNR